MPRFADDGNAGSQPENVDVLVVGMGFAGLYILHRPRRLSRVHPVAGRNGRGEGRRRRGLTRVIHRFAIRGWGWVSFAGRGASVLRFARLRSISEPTQTLDDRKPLQVPFLGTMRGKGASYAAQHIGLAWRSLHGLHR